MEEKELSRINIKCFFFWAQRAPHLVLDPAVTAVCQGTGQNEAVAGRGQVKYALSDDKAHPEKDVAGRQKWDHQEHQSQA